MSNRKMIREYDQVGADGFAVALSGYTGRWETTEDITDSGKAQARIMAQIEDARWWLARASGIVSESKRKSNGLSPEDLELLAICQNNLALCQFYMEYTE
tara:strand:- start:57 stop:356 length:300 start_codon:yes stop_codon:yes gene_type:complete